MIHLDTNYLIALAVVGSPEAQRVDQWLAAGESVATSALAWTEFLNGPVQPQEIALVESVIESRSFLSIKRRWHWLPNCSTRPGDGAVRGSTA